MLLKTLREEVLEANLELVRRGLVLCTFGNVSAVSREEGLVVIKPSGIPYENMSADQMVVTDLEGKIVDGSLRPSSDLATHIVLYRCFPEIGGVAHSHSPYATAWAQAHEPIPCLGTTHADYYCGPVPVTDAMTEDEIRQDYETSTGHAIVRTLEPWRKTRPPGVLVASHGPFTWGANAANAVENSAILEHIARMAYLTLSVNPATGPITETLHHKHFLRKHGASAYYGQSGIKKE
ncbi:MAG TPA: L-ribulose-5-phosphate 4-epimerase AraD [Terriglobales bacterium]|nr:L-ribulose-5-phosphate 4-epimerase AraD [Terriglobales bacterium]